MILRVVNGRFPRDRLTAVREELERSYVPIAQGQPGLDRYLIATSPSTANECRIAFMTAWLDVEAALVAYEGNLAAARTLDGVSHGTVLEHVDYYEVGSGEVRRNAGIPRYLRLTAGTLGQGLDADVQRELRGRLGGLPDSVVDAYVGRRVKGPLVEIAFASTWTADADVTALRLPIWPDISANYEAFSVGVLEVLLEGMNEG